MLLAAHTEEPAYKGRFVQMEIVARMAPVLQNTVGLPALRQSVAPVVTVHTKIVVHMSAAASVKSVGHTMAVLDIPAPLVPLHIGAAVPLAAVCMDNHIRQPADMLTGESAKCCW
ncbi:hypothetical protein HG530_006663 [Fusarium avenaceum]|nr:hypothetical protein HG530_006663 [Fusarium avenaceum]